ncbi:MAG: hypothetical protein J1G06_09600 [Oscillospiraceae bacterium]|nr:hypothetical protein [Oscillospiraceae bacterium]
MSKISDKILKCMATTAEEAFLEAMGLASRSGSYEPEMPDELKTYKANHTSKLEALFDKIAK